MRIVLGTDWQVYIRQQNPILATYVENHVGNAPAEYKFAINEFPNKELNDALKTAILSANKQSQVLYFETHAKLDDFARKLQHEYQKLCPSLKLRFQHQIDNFWHLLKSLDRAFWCMNYHSNSIQYCANNCPFLDPKKSTFAVYHQ